MRAISELYTHRLLLIFFLLLPLLPLLLLSNSSLPDAWLERQIRVLRCAECSVAFLERVCVCVDCIVYAAEYTQPYTHSMILIVVLMFHIRIHIFTNPWLFGMFEHVLCTYASARALTVCHCPTRSNSSFNSHTQAHIPSHINFLDFLLRRLVAGDWASKPLMNEWTNTHARMSLNIPSSVYAHTHTLTHTCRTKWMFLC